MVYTPERRQLIEAVEQNDLKTLKFLVKEKRVPISPTVALIAVEKGYMKILEYVAKERPSVLESRDQDGNDILHLGVEKGTLDLKMLKFLSEKKKVSLVNMNDQLQTVARIAAKNGNLDIVKYVAETKPLVLSKRDSHGKTVLHMDDEKNVMSLIEFLEQKYGDDIPHWRRLKFESEAIHSAIQLGHWNVLKYFLEEKKCDVDIGDDRDETPIYTALRCGRYDMFKYLVEERNADLTMVNEKVETILFVTVDKNDLPTMKYVLDERKAGIDVDWSNIIGRTILHEVVLANRTNFLDYLVEQKRANVSATANGMLTPLHCAASRNNHEICRYLLEHGADARAQDEEGFYPMSPTGDEQLNSYLREARAGRIRRSVGPLHPAIDGDTIILQDSDQRTADLEMNRLQWPTASSLRSFYSYQLPNFLLIVNLMLFKNARTLAYPYSDGRVPCLSRTDVLRDRVDPVAVDAVLNSIRGVRRGDTTL